MSSLKVLLFILCISLSAAEWMQSLPSNLLPINITEQVIGFDSSNNIIWLIGGDSDQLTNNYKSLIQYNINSNNFTLYHNYLPIEIASNAKSYTQIENLIYFLQDNRESTDIATFNVQSLTLIPSKYNISTNVGLWACITHSNDNQFLFVLGGYDGESILDSFWILNLFTNEWKRGKDMVTSRRRFGCVVTENDYLYAIGGYAGGLTARSIIKINVSTVGDNDYIHYAVWDTLDEYLSVANDAFRSTLVGDDIYIIGGDLDKSMDIIHTNNDTVSTVDVESFVNVEKPAVIVADGRIWSFGGDRVINGNRIAANIWQYMEIDTETDYLFTMTTAIPAEQTTLETSKPSVAPTDFLEVQNTTDFVLVNSNFSETEAIEILGTMVTFDEELSDLYGYASVVIVFVFAMVGIMGYIDANYIHSNDIFRISFVIIFGIYSMDFISDIFFAATVFNEHCWFIFIPSCIFLVVPVIVNLYQLKKEVSGWMNDMENGLFIVYWMDNYSKLLYTLSLISGSGFAAVKMLNSALFRSNKFEMGLKKHQMRQFQNKRLFSVVLMENIPQIALQTTFAIMNDYFKGIPLMALIWSVFSIILSVFEYFTKKSIEQHHDENCDIYCFQIGVKSDEIINNRKSLRYQIKKINAKIAELLDIDRMFVEQLRCMNINGGLKLIFRIRLIKRSDGDKNGRSISEMETIISEAIEDGVMGKLIKDSWELTHIPQIKHFLVHDTMDEREGSETETIEV